MTETDNGQQVLVVGGTGMLRGTVRDLTRRGHTVYAVARRPARGAPEAPAPGEFVPVPSEWSEAGRVGRDVLAAMRSRATTPHAMHGAILWVHSPHRQAVLDQLVDVLAPDATVLQLWGSAATNPRKTMAQEHSTRHPWTMRHLVLGYHREAGYFRWLTDEEISRAALRAWDGDERVSVAGQVEPWARRP